MAGPGILRGGPLFHRPQGYAQGARRLADRRQEVPQACAGQGCRQVDCGSQEETQVKNSKSETRNPKQIRITKKEICKRERSLVYDFLLRILNLFRISSFGFRISESI